VGALLGGLISLGCDGAVEGRRDLLLVTVDTLRADRLGAYESALGLSPNLDALASESQVFTRAFSPASYTLPAVISLLTGRQPDELGIRANVSVLRGGVPTLATRLWAQGWRTGAVVSNAVLQKRVGLHVGFDRYDDEFPDWERNRRVPERVAADTTDAALAMLASLRGDGDAPVFLWVHYQDPHGPYTPPPGYREKFMASEREMPDGTRRLPFDDTQTGQGGIPAYQQIDQSREVERATTGSPTVSTSPIRSCGFPSSFGRRVSPRGAGTTWRRWSISFRASPAWSEPTRRRTTPGATSSPPTPRRTRVGCSSPPGGSRRCPARA
jgi:hypothetical protein